MPWQMYAVGSDNISGVGDQKKHFVSKSTLLYTTQENLEIKLNSMNNVTIVLLVDTWYEFKSNIHSIYVNLTTVASEELVTYLKCYFEGVMYHEARRPE